MCVSTIFRIIISSTTKTKDYGYRIHAWYDEKLTFPASEASYIRYQLPFTMEELNDGYLPC